MSSFFSSHQIDPNPPVNKTYLIDCRMSYYVIMDVMLIFSFLYGLIVFRWEGRGRPKKPPVTENTETPQKDRPNFENVSYLIVIK